MNAPAAQELGLQRTVMDVPPNFLGAERPTSSNFGLIAAVGSGLRDGSDPNTVSYL